MTSLFEKAKANATAQLGVSKPVEMLPVDKVLKGAKATMSTKEIADLTGKQHKNVLRDARKMLTNLGKDQQLKTELVEEINGLGIKVTTPVIHLDKNETLCLVTGYSDVLRMKVIERMESLENRLMEIAKNRLETKDEYKGMMKALVQTRQELGKDTEFYHRSNECDMINRIVIGSTSKKYKEVHGLPKDAVIRDYFTAMELEAVAELERHNSSLISMQMDLTQRKEMLQNLFDRRFAGKLHHSRALIDYRH